MTAPGAPSKPAPDDDPADVFGVGPMADAMRAFDWAGTPIGALQAWPRSLKTVVRLMLDSRYAMWLAWGPELTFFCNDAYRPTLGAKEGFIGAPASAVWAEIWPDIGPRIDHVLSRGEATWDTALLLFLERHGFKEETYHSFSYSPVRGDEGGIEGMLCVVTEDTERTVGERRLAALAALAGSALATHDVGEACQAAAQSLGRDGHDAPFVLIYLLDDEAKTARCASHAGLDMGRIAQEQRLDDERAPWPFAAAMRSGMPQRVEDVPSLIGQHPAGPWSDPVRRALVLPLARAGHSERFAGFLVAGLSPRLPFDDKYERFLTLAAGQTATAIADARAFEEQRRRAEELAALDRAKTAFFTNVSHEFRTPLTLLLGPLQELREAASTPPQRALADMAQRNAQRLLKLVNTLLDFARVEGGRAEARFVATDIGAVTADLASSFRSVCEQAGLGLVVDCPSLARPVFVDRDMWEKVVLNLLSNAFKFTLQGGISVRLRGAAEGSGAELEIADTGCGIAAADLPRLFSRFERIEGAPGRSIEGSGIGLSLVAELLKLHGASIEVDSEPGRGTTFRVRLRGGHAHLPPDHVDLGPARGETAGGQVAAYVGEAATWLHEPGVAGDADAMAASLDEAAVRREGAARVLLADDNADLRGYLRRLLEGRYRVTEAADGVQALELARQDPPDLLVSDVMMPGLSGFELVKRLRADARTRALPMILLSARAGEEARIEGLAGGADDYLVKPFAARELLARVEAQLAASRVRREASSSIAAVVEQSLVGVARIALDGHFIGVNARFREIAGRDAESLNALTLAGISPAEERPRVEAEFSRLVRGETGSLVIEGRYLRPDRQEVWVRSHLNLLRDADGHASEAVAVVLDISERKRTEEALRRRETQLRQQLAELEAIHETAPLGMATFDRDFRFRRINARLAEMNGVPASSHIGRSPHEIVPAVVDAVEPVFRRVVANGRVERIELQGQTLAAPGVDRVWEEVWYPLMDATGAVSGVGVLVDEVTEQRRAQMELREAERRKDEFLATLSHELRNPLAPLRNGLHILRLMAAGSDKSRPVLDTMERQVSHLVRLVDDLMEVSRITRGKVDLKRQWLDLADVLRQAAETIGPKLRAARNTLDLRTPEGPTAVNGDAVRLTQVFANLLDNASKYSDAGSRIVLSLEREGRQAVVRVVDQGAGIPAEMLKRVFDLFTQVDRTLGRAQGGLGIGLALVKRLVDMHGGSVEAHSGGAGRGSVFTVKLPLIESGPAAVDEPGGHENAPMSLSGQRILVVDDNRDAADSLAEILRALGADACTAYDGASGLEAMRAFRPPIVLLDLGMPGMSGYAVAAQLRAEPQYQTLKLVALTGWGQQEDLRRTQEAGFDAHLVKPVEPAQLVSLLIELAARDRPAPQTRQGMP
ncbi:MAG: ATP-binding protein [Burkholderiaceae bacterium]